MGKIRQHRGGDGRKGRVGVGVKDVIQYIANALGFTVALSHPKGEGANETSK